MLLRGSGPVGVASGSHTMSRKKLAPGCEDASFCNRTESSGSLRRRYGSGSQFGLAPRLSVASGVSPPPTGGSVSPQSMMPVISVSWNSVSRVCSAAPRGPGGGVLVASLQRERSRRGRGVDAQDHPVEGQRRIDHPADVLIIAPLRAEGHRSRQQGGVDEVGAEIAVGPDGDAVERLDVQLGEVHLLAGQGSRQRDGERLGRPVHPPAGQPRRSRWPTSHRGLRRPGRPPRTAAPASA